MTALTYELIGQRLKAARENVGLTQAQVAKYLEDHVKTSREYISYYETGTRQIDTLTLTKLANLYGYSLSYFLATNELNEVPVVSAAFRAEDFSSNDLETIGWVKNFAKNLSSLNKILGE